MQTNLDINQIMKILPHRYPFLMVDRVLSMEENKIVALKNVTRNEEFFNGHFPGMPVMPGVLQVEAMAQTAGLYMVNEEKYKTKMGLFAAIDNVKFRNPVVPGDQLIIEVEMIKIGKLTSCKGVAKVDEKIACEAEIKFVLVDPPSQVKE